MSLNDIMLEWWYSRAETTTTSSSIRPSNRNSPMPTPAQPAAPTRTPPVVVPRLPPLPLDLGRYRHSVDDRCTDWHNLLDRMWSVCSTASTSATLGVHDGGLVPGRTYRIVPESERALIIAMSSSSYSIYLDPSRLPGDSPVTTLVPVLTGFTYQPPAGGGPHRSYTILHPTIPNLSITHTRFIYDLLTQWAFAYIRRPVAFTLSSALENPDETTAGLARTTYLHLGDHVRRRSHGFYAIIAQPCANVTELRAEPLILSNGILDFNLARNANTVSGTRMLEFITNDLPSFNYVAWNPAAATPPPRPVLPPPFTGSADEVHRHPHALRIIFTPRSTEAPAADAILPLPAGSKVAIYSRPAPGQGLRPQKVLTFPASGLHSETALNLPTPENAMVP